MRTGGKELTFIAAVLVVNAFILLQGTGVVYEAFSWKAFAQVYKNLGEPSIGDATDDPDADAILGSGRDHSGNFDVFNPSGCLYNEATGTIVSGGSVNASVSCDAANFIPNGGDPMNGSMGCFALVYDLECDPTFTFTFTPPAGCVLSTDCPDQGAVATTGLSPSGEQFISVGNFPDASLSTVSTTCTDWYSEITFDAQDASGVVNSVVNNNVALDCSSLCGNGVLDTNVGETCDDGNQVSGDGCSEDCVGPEEGFTCPNQPGPCENICGDELVVLGEECDEGNANSDNAPCTADCQDAACGDGLECTLGGCTTGPAGGAEECDDANASNNDACLNSCAAAACSDGFVCSDVATCTTGPMGGAEECDDANANDNDSCLNSCATAICGDDVVCSDEATCTSGPGGGIELCDGDEIEICTDECGFPPAMAPTLDLRGIALAVAALFALGLVALKRRSPAARF